MNSLNPLEKNKTLIFVFIQKITAKNMQDVIFFLQKNNFKIKRITSNKNKTALTSFFVNSNFILENQHMITSQQLQKIINFLNQHTVINGVLFKNHVLDLERISRLDKDSRLTLWKQIFTLTI